MKAETGFARAVEAIYAAAADAEQWPRALQVIADCFGDIGANLIYRRDDGSTATIASPGLHAAQEDYQRGWWQQDIRWTRAQEFVYRSNSGAITDRHVASDYEMATHPFYTDFQRRHGLRWIVSMEVSPEPFVTVALSVHRGPEGTPPYSDEDLDLLTQLGRHVEQALRLSIRLIRAELTNVGLLDVLSHMSSGIFVLDSNANVVFSNEAARALGGDGLSIVGRRLTVASPALQREFAEKLDMVTGDYLNGPQGFVAPLLIARTDDKRPLVAHVMPICSPQHTALDRILGQARAIVIVRDLNEQQAPDPAMVRDILGVTLAEARVAALIATGVSPRDAAAALGIKEDTARSALKSVYAKVGLSRQAELSALIGKLAFRLPT